MRHSVDREQQPEPLIEPDPWMCAGLNTIAAHQPQPKRPAKGPSTATDCTGSR